MIDLYTWATPNGHKVHIMLEETGLEYNVHGINIRTGDQFGEAFLKVSPNNRIPAIVDQDGPGGKPLSLFETGAILVYLGDKTGQFFPRLEDDAHAHYKTIQWLMFQMGGVGPMFGQASHFLDYAPERHSEDELKYATERYTKECNRLYGVMDRRLADADYLADEYSVADMAAWPWCRAPERRGVDPEDYPNVQRWFDRIAERPAVQRAVKILEVESKRPGKHDDKAWSAMFGDQQFQRTK